MNRVVRSEVLPRKEYEKVREPFRKAILAQKEHRRVHLGPELAFLFENHDTVLYQIQEMIRVESLDGESEINHEIATYNELIGERGELGCTLLIEIDEPARRAEVLARWLDLPASLYLETADGRRIPPVYDRRQVGERRISSVHYLRFRVGDGVPKKIGCDHPELKLETELKPAQVAALCRDLIA